MAEQTLVNGTDLVAWAARKDAETTLPRLIRRLINATTIAIEQISFPADEGVQLGGWDGQVRVKDGNEFTPKGTSVWELGTNLDTKGKADDDYNKRTNNPLDVVRAETAFVFVTPRRWAGKGKWIKARKAEGIWLDVRVYDADDLEQWLEQAPAVHLWLSVLLGKHPESAYDLATFWTDWAEATAPPLNPDLILAGRGKEAKAVHDWLEGEASVLGLQADSNEEALAVFSAMLYQLPPDERIAYLSRAVVAENKEAWQRLLGSSNRLLLIPKFDDAGGIARAIRAGHHVMVPLGKEDAQATNPVSLPRIRRQPAKEALLKLGLSNERADELAALARRNLTTLRRRLAFVPKVQRPAWAPPGEARALLPMVLAGAWDDTNIKDQEAIARLADVSYKQVTETLIRWKNEPDAPVRRIGSTWMIVSKEDAWNLLSKFMTRTDIERFKGVVLELLGQVDPRFDLPEAERWYAGARGISIPNSGLLRSGLADTIAILGASSDSSDLADASLGQTHASTLVRELLNRASNDWRLWASLSSILPLLAEAAPDEFLDAVDIGVSGQEPTLRSVFVDQDHALFVSSPHTGLLWALEALAWNPAYLGRAAVLLTKLAVLDPHPASRHMNRPVNSLRDIFLLWNPQTSADLVNRLQVLDSLRSREPSVAWKLLVRLLPEFHAISHPTSKPRLRDWMPDPPQVVTRENFWNATEKIMARLLTDVQLNGSRWHDLIKRIEYLPKEHQNKIVDFLNRDGRLIAPADQLTLRDELRSIVTKHRSFPDADWVLPSEQIDMLEAAYKRFETGDAKSRNAWLFSNSPDLPEVSRSDWETWHTALNDARLSAAREIYKQGGLDYLLETAEEIEQPRELGFVIGKSELLNNEENALLLRELGSDHASRRSFMIGFTSGRFQSQGWTWVEHKQQAPSSKLWSPQQTAQFYLSLPSDRRTWSHVDATHPEAQREYWSRIGSHLEDRSDAEFMTSKLLEYGRPYVAIDMISLYSQQSAPIVPPAVIADVLNQAVISTEENALSVTFAHNVSELLNILDLSGQIDENKMASFEWAFLILLQNHRAPKLLHSELSRNPDFFIEMLFLIFRDKNEPQREYSDDERARARLAYQLIDSWRLIPGTREDSSVDSDALRGWVHQVREKALKAGREEITDQYIGHVLAFSPAGADRSWPDVPIRDVVEQIESQHLETGIEIQVYNNRGVVSRSPLAGGEQERQLVERYSLYASALSDRWPRTAAMLRRLAATYEAEARREDDEAELREDLWD